MTNEHSEFFSHFPKGVSDALDEYAGETVFLASRYLFVWRVKQVQMAYCTHCHVEYPIGIGKASFKHNEKTICLNCTSECVVKSNGMGRSKLLDDAYVVWYEKSVLNPNAIVAIVLHAWRDYRGDYRKNKTEFSTRAFYLFEPGQGGRLFRPDWNEQWSEKRSVFSLRELEMKYKEAFCSSENIKNAVAGTPFQYSKWEEYYKDTFDYVDFFDMVAKYPSVEYLTKMGLGGLVTAKLRGHKTYGVVHWRGKSLEKVLRMPRSDVRQLKDISGILPLSLYSYHFWRKLGWTISPGDAHIIRGLTEGYYAELLTKQSEYGTEIEITKYLLKQMRRPNAPAIYSSVTYVLTAWRDYVNECKELGMDLQQSHVLFPSNLHHAHDKTMSKVKLKRNEETNKRIAARVPDLEKYAFTHGQLLIRPATNSLELFDEGKTLNHCVGGYSNRYAAGQIDLFLLRKVSDPDTPLCTVEVVSGKIIQARGYKNRQTNAQEEAFLKRFERHLRLVKKRLNRHNSRLEVQGIAG